MAAFDQSSQPPAQSHSVATANLANPHSQPWQQSQGGPSYHQQDQQQPARSEQFVSAPAAVADGQNNNPALAYQQQYYGEKGGPAATAPFLRDFTLVAEAVRRVQMDRVMSEMERVTL